MNPKPPKSPSPSAVKTITEELVKLFQWILELIRSRNWFTLLLLADVSLILFLTPGGVVAQFLNNWFSFSLPEWYKLAFWLTVSILFLAAMIVAVVTMPSSSKEETGKINERSIIKGLQPFRYQDREIFARLQRRKSIQECWETIINPNFRFGIILGESGCGKTSFLQAGLCPKLNEPEGSNYSIYIRFSTQEPITTIRKIFCQTLPLQESEVANLDLLALLKLGTEAVAPKPLVLFFDQFEQFLVHYQRKEDRKPFIDALYDWYVSALPVKIVISIREDLTGRLVELQKALGYSLAPQDVHRLEKFTPNEACKILTVIAEGENIRFEERFIEELAERELASREDSLISPVDLQILAWMVEGQKIEELRAFNRLAFQKLGGIEGLLHRFLERTLEARIVPSERQAAVKVLLVLTDLDRQVRAGAFTIAQLQNKLQASLSRTEVAEATHWLARGDVRLLTPFEEEDGTHYELAHERLIPVLLRLAGKELSEVDKANQLLERRVNEWLGNNRNPRFLLGIRDLWLIQHQKPYLIWGSKQQHKERLIVASWRKIKQVVTALTLIVLFIFFSSGWLLYTPAGQIQQVRWQINNPLGSSLERVSDGQVAEAGIAIAKDERWQLAFDLIDKYINRAEDKAFFIVGLAKIVPQQEGSNQAQAKLQKALTVTKEINDPYYQSNVLSAIIQAYGQLEDHAAAQEGLKSILKITEQIDEPSDQSYVLSVIIQDYGQLEDQAATQEGLKSILKITEQIDEPSDQSYVLSVIIQAYGQLEDHAAAQEGLKSILEITEQISSLRYQSDVLSAIAQAYGQLKDHAAAQEILKSALKITEQIKNRLSQNYALRGIVQAYSQLKDHAATQEGLNSALKITEQIYDLSDQPDYLSTIMQLINQFKQVVAQEGLNPNILSINEDINKADERNYALRAIAQAYGQLEDQAAAQEGLKSILKITEQIDEPSDQSDVLSAIVQAYSQLEDQAATQEGLKSILEITEQIDDPSDQSDVLSAIAQAYGQLEDQAAAQEGLKSILEITEQIDDPYNQSLALSAIAEASAQTTNIEVAQTILHDTLLIAEAANASSTLEKIAVLYAQQFAWGKALRALRNCPESLKVNALAQILTLWAEKNNPKLIDGAVVLALEPKSTNEGYTFDVTIHSRDRDCNYYADWWEVLSEDGTLLDRQVFQENHADQRDVSSTRLYQYKTRSLTQKLSTAKPSA